MIKGILIRTQSIYINMKSQVLLARTVSNHRLMTLYWQVLSPAPSNCPKANTNRGERGTTPFLHTTEADRKMARNAVDGIFLLLGTSSQDVVEADDHQGNTHEKLSAEYL